MSSNGVSPEASNVEEVIMATETTENDVQDAVPDPVDLTSFEKSLGEVVKAIEALARVYNELPEEQQDAELARIHEEYPYAQEMIVLLLRRWPLMP